MAVLFAQNRAGHRDDRRVTQHHQAVASLSVIIAERVTELASEIGCGVKRGTRRHHYRDFSVLRRRRDVHRRHKGVRFLIAAVRHLGYENFWLSHF